MTQQLTASNVNGGFSLVGALCFPARASDTVQIKATAAPTSTSNQLLLFYDDQAGSFDSFGTTTYQAEPLRRWILDVKKEVLHVDSRCEIQREPRSKEQQRENNHVKHTTTQ